MQKVISILGWRGVDLLAASPTSTIIVGGGTIWAIFIIHVMYSLFFHPLAKFPGPKLAAVSHVWYAIAVFGGNPHKAITELHRRYGPVVRIAPNELSFSTYTSFQTLHSHKTSRSFLKSPLYDAFINGSEPSLIGVRDPIEHGKRKRFLSHAFSSKALSDHVPTIQYYSDLFVERMREHGTRPGGMNMTEWFNWFTFDVIGDLAFGESFHCLESAKGHFWVSVVLNHSSTISVKDILRRFWLLAPLVRRAMSSKGAAEGRIKHYNYSALKTQERMNTKTDRKDFMSYLLDQQDPDGVLNQSFLTVSASTFVVAGSETTASALAGTTYWILKTPAAHAKLVAELRSHFQSAADITAASSQGLPYLTGCIEEGLRVFPPAPNGAPRVSPGAEIDGFYVPKGTVCSTHPVAMNRDPKYFHDPDAFLPERWCGNDKGDRLEASQPFLIGPRACIGRNLAYMEMRLLLAKMFYGFELRLHDEGLDWDGETTIRTFWRKPDLMVEFESR